MEQREEVKTEFSLFNCSALEPTQQARYDFLQTRLHVLEGDYATALRLSDQTRAAFNSLYTPATPERTRWYETRMAIFDSLGQRDRILPLIDTAISLILTDWMESKPVLGSMPPRADFPRIQRLMVARAKYLTDADDLPEAFVAWETAHHLLDSVRYQLQTDASKLFLRKSASTTLDQALAVALQLYREYPFEDYAQRAFNLIEARRAGLLLDAALAAEAQGIDLIPQAIRDSLGQLRALIYQLESRLDEADNADRLYEVRTAYQDLLDIIQAEYPEYHRLRYAKSEFDFDKIQESIRIGRQNLLTFYEAEDFYYRIWLEPSGEWQFDAIARTPELRAAITDFIVLFDSPMGIQEDFFNYCQGASDLYRILIPESSDSNWLIVPDGMLYRMPFGALIADMEARAGGSFTYMLEKGRVNYGYSCRMLFRNARDLDLGSGLWFAPLFESGEQGLRPLPHSASEMSNIDFSMDYDTLMGEVATRESLIKNLPYAAWAQLSTHAQDLSAEGAFLYTIDSSLSLADIYGLSLQSDLIVLSACETDRGVYQTGEGVFSLARAFRQAGSNSVIASQWSVPDRTTALLFQEFYRQIGLGLDKSEALRQAQLAILDHPELSAAQRSPYYWAAFKFIGQDGAWVEKKWGSWYCWLLPFLFLGLLGIRRISRKTKI
ncbi:MAG: CHAT domain-containing protein [Bacteroidota bacterium]